MKDSETLRDLVNIITECMKAIGIVASAPVLKPAVAPRTLGEFRQELLRSIERFLSAGPLLQTAQSGKKSLADAEPVVREFQALVEQWKANEEPGPAFTERARECLMAMGVPEPPGGWKQLAGQFKSTR